MNMTTKSPASGKVDTSNIKHTPILIALLLGAMVALLNETLLFRLTPTIFSILRR